MDEDISKKLDEMQKQLSAVYVSVEKTRKYFQWTLIITLVTVVLPLIGLIFVIPMYLGTLTSFSSI